MENKILKKEKHINSSKKPACCPRCKEEFVVNVQCTTSYDKGGVERYNPIGYLMELQCKKCRTIFPYFRGTAEDAEIVNEIINRNKALISEGIIGEVGVGLAQQMISGMDGDGVIGYFQGILSQSDKRDNLKS